MNQQQDGTHDRDGNGMVMDSGRDSGRNDGRNEQDPIRDDDELLGSSGPHCHFYGMSPHPNFEMFVMSKGNQCGLVTNAFSPCRMEMRGQKPDLETCELKDSENAEKFRDFELVCIEAMNLGDREEPPDWEVEMRAKDQQEDQ